MQNSINEANLTNMSIDDEFIIDNSKTISITETIVDTNAPKHYENVEQEDIQDPRQSGRIVYPPDLRFVFSYQCWHEHQENMWTSHETHPENDAYKFNQADVNLRVIMLRFIACLMWGDNTVLEFLENDIIDTITVPEVRFMLDDQKARENVHQEIYSKMLDVAELTEAQYYRSESFKNRYMQKFADLSKKYQKCKDLRIILYFIMLCENILFAPAFQAICYLAYKGYAPKLGDLNRQVMRDEYIHYKHARGLLCSLRTKLNATEAIDILKQFYTLTGDLIDEIVEDYESIDGLFSKTVLREHLDYIVCCFITENGLHDRFVNRDSSPANIYMTLPQHETKINLMEANSTIYMINKCDDVHNDLNMDFTQI